MAIFIIVIIASLLVASLLHLWLNFERPSVKHVKGPPSPSSWLGHQRALRDQDNAGDLETKWRREYGTLYRISGCLGQDVLVVCDPTVLGHVFNPSRPYPKSNDSVFILDLLAGKGLAVVASGPHHRQRKILNPAFSTAQLRTYRFIFQQCGDKLVNGIKGYLAGTGTSNIINIRAWTSKTTLDIIGLAAFRHDFTSIDGSNTEIEQAVRHVFTASQANPSASELILVDLMRMLPDPVLELLRLVPTREFRQLISVGKVAKKIAREITARHNGVQSPEGVGDVLDVLAKARLEGRIQDDEVEAQLMTFILAASETTGTSISWLLYELAVHPEHQSIIRGELKQSDDHDSLPFLNAAIKESLRLHPNAPSLIRTAPHDDVLPLSGGKTLAVPKGQTLVLPSLWGDDAEEWNPARFLDNHTSVSLGVYANLLTFGTGPRSCIGWRFAVMEIQTILASLILNFEFSLPEGGIEILRFPGSPAVVPIVKGEAHLGSQLPLRLRVL
ncbi:cytochrome P450 [Armillaria luteobubalina]|uniref:Cytochrome P450 n=1 Tax=Armillaria luteobubalina TaxID=153913 RepID=A0AA39QPE0_9AGAR|nr:cytochrome P450 [Armillaria luteobubalina]